MGSAGERYWRIRIKYSAEEELTKQAWERKAVGIWYGAWSAQDLSLAIANETKCDPVEYLSNLPQQKALDWGKRIPRAFVNTAKRFAAIKETDWVYVFFDDALHFGRVCGAIQSHLRHELNREGELFKCRPILEKKRFRLGRLPESFRLLSSAGRGNVYEVHGTNRRLVSLLANSESEEEVLSKIEQMPWKEWLDILGPTSWESLCLGYLILQESFVPTGLAVGRTLPIFDIIGRSQQHGGRIFAQCKKAPYPVSIDEDFKKACSNLLEGSKVYFFAFGGCNGAPPGVRVMARSDMEDWFENDSRGQRYLKMLR